MVIVAQQKRQNLIRVLCVQLLYLVPRLLPEARRAPLSAPSPETLREPPPVDGGQEWDPRCWGGTAGTCVATWRNSALQLWRNPTFGQLAQLPQYRVRRRRAFSKHFPLCVKCWLVKANISQKGIFINTWPPKPNNCNCTIRTSDGDKYNVS